MPVGDSNTYALYQKGWRGVAMEPLPYQQFWQEARPEDVFLNVAVGDKSGSLTLQVYDDMHQISSGIPETARHWERNGIKPSRSVEVPVVTLDQVIAEYLPDLTLHLLCIDVEGMEHQVLKGLDLKVHRPWVVVLEATEPGSTVPTHQAWEPLLLQGGYLMSYFDGLNRFYLAQERRSLQGLFTLLNATMKKLSQGLDCWLVGFLRYLLGTMVILAPALRHGVRELWPKAPKLQLLRGSFHAGGMLLWFAALPTVSIAEFTSIGFSVPIFICL